mgnify:CR=1 FL=1
MIDSGTTTGMDPDSLFFNNGMDDYLTATAIVEAYAADGTWSTEQVETYNAMTKDQAYANEGCRIEFAYHQFS